MPLSTPPHRLKNQLSGQASAYLAMHADNPVAWQLWSDATFAEAQRLQKPIFLSIGYSASHWCSVMETESFADVDTAEILNRHFVSIKVDREERPDLDDVYQIAHHLLTGRPGGWPLTLFLCPKTRLPFIAGTYYTKDEMPNVMSFTQLLDRVKDFYQTREKEFLNLRTQIRRGYDSLQPGDLGKEFDLRFDAQEVKTFRDTAAASLLLDADTYNGGFGQSSALQKVGAVQTKFPLPTNLQSLLRGVDARDSMQRAARQHAFFTLSQMAKGGLQDHLGGGFFRYAVDSQWCIPHFEKMLYDNAQLLSTYVQAVALHGSVDESENRGSLLENEQAALGIVHWLMSEMRSSQGVYFSAMSADYGGDDGGYYIWDKKTLLMRLSPAEKNLMTRLFQLDGSPNYGDAWHLAQVMSEDEAIAEEGLDLREGREFLANAKAKCLSIRGQIPLPMRDEKIICSSNALLIKALSEATRVFSNDDFIDLAHEAIDFIYSHLWINKRLYSLWQGGEACFMAYLNDYVFLMDALLCSLQVRWRDRDYQFLLHLAEALIENFEDRSAGGFFFTAHDHEVLIYRHKPDIDNVLPAGNGIAAKVLLRLAHLAAEPRYQISALKTVRWARKNIQEQPHLHHTLLLAHEELVSPVPIVLLVGGAEMSEWALRIYQRFGHKVHCFQIPTDSNLHPPEAMVLEEGEGLVCVGGRSLLAQRELLLLMSQLDEVLSAQ